MDADFNSKQEEMQRYEDLKNDKIRSLESRVKMLKSKIETTRKSISTTKKSIDSVSKEVNKMEKEFEAKRSSINIGGFVAHFIDTRVIPAAHKTYLFISDV